MPTSKVPPSSVQLTYALVRVAHVLKLEEGRRASEQGLSATQAQILVRLARSQTPQRLAPVASDLGLSAPTCSVAINSLVRKKLLKRVREVRDRRALAMRLTAKGRRAAAQAQHWPDFLEVMLAELSRDEQTTLFKAMVRLILTLQSGGWVASNRVCIHCNNFRPDHCPGSAQPHLCHLTSRRMSLEEMALDCRGHDPVSPAVAAARLQILEG